MNGLLQRLNETVVTRRGSMSGGSAVSSTFGNVFSSTPTTTTGSTTAAASSSTTAAAAQGAPSVIFPCSVRPIPFTVPTFPSTFLPPLTRPAGARGDSNHTDESAASAGRPPGSTSSYFGVDNFFSADYRGKKCFVVFFTSRTLRS